ncbi:DUF6069 family protein [Streptosporangium subroseum]|uniref:DUF6069 family protein n=1 Tax=Streptosporangium subroseum TaxID=106412 RepID=UPI00343823F5
MNKVRQRSPSGRGARQEAIVTATYGPLHTGDPGKSHANANADAVPAGLFRFGVVLCTELGTVLAVGVVCRAARPQRTFVRVALALTTVSFALPLAPSHTTTSARLLLAGGHVLAAAIVIPGLTWAIRRAPRHL